MCARPSRAAAARALPGSLRSTENGPSGCSVRPFRALSRARGDRAHRHLDESRFPCQGPHAQGERDSPAERPRHAVRKGRLRRPTDRQRVCRRVRRRRHRGARAGRPLRHRSVQPRLRLGLKFHPARARSATTKSDLLRRTNLRTDPDGEGRTRFVLIAEAEFPTGHLNVYQSADCSGEPVAGAVSNMEGLEEGEFGAGVEAPGFATTTYTTTAVDAFDVDEFGKRSEPITYTNLTEGVPSSPTNPRSDPVSPSNATTFKVFADIDDLTDRVLVSWGGGIEADLVIDAAEFEANGATITIDQGESVSVSIVAENEEGTIQTGGVRHLRVDTEAARRSPDQIHRLEAARRASRCLAVLKGARSTFTRMQPAPASRS